MAVATVREFLDREMTGEGFEKLFPEAGVEIDIIVQENLVPAHPADHPVCMAIPLVLIPWNQDNLGLEIVLQLRQYVAIEREGILLEDLVGHDDLVPALDHVAAVHDDIGGDAIQPQVFADGRIGWNKVLKALEVIRRVPVEKELILLQLDGHVVPRPDVLLGIRHREELCLDIPATQARQESFENSSVVYQSLGQKHFIGLIVTNHIGCNMLQNQSRALLPRPARHRRSLRLFLHQDRIGSISTH